MLELKDKIIEKAIMNENKRQLEHIELIASENYVSKDVLKATGSILTNKYAEGYSGRRYYDGCQYIDVVELTAIARLKEIFGVKFANVQPHSGSQANAAAIASMINLGDKIMGASLDAGGHLTHGYHISFSGRFYKAVNYGMNDEGVLDYEAIKKLAMKEKPKLIICGYSAYSRTIDFKKFKEIADSCGAYLLADIAHVAGLIAVGAHPSPVGYADVITSTTHKTLRGARGGIIMTNDEKLAKKIDRWVFPGYQGGPLMHSIAGKAVAFYEAMQPEFKTYIEQVVKNTYAFAEEFKKMGVPIVSGGTDNHLFTVDVKKGFGITGKKASEILQKNNITVNKNTITNDTESPFVTSGIRLGGAAMTSRGWKEEQFIKLAQLMQKVLKDESISIKSDVLSMALAFPHNR